MRPLSLAAMNDLHSGVQSQAQEILHKLGVSEIVFLKKPHKRTEEIRIAQCKGFYMEHCGSGTPQPANKFKMAGRWMKLQQTQLPLDVALHCSVFVLPMQKFLC